MERTTSTLASSTGTVPSSAIVTVASGLPGRSAARYSTVGGKNRSYGRSAQPKSRTRPSSGTCRSRGEVLQPGGEGLDDERQPMPPVRAAQIGGAIGMEARGGWQGAYPNAVPGGEPRYDPAITDLRRHAARGTLVTSAFHVAMAAVGLLQRLAIAAFITRAEYGLWAIILTILVTLAWLKQLGIGDKYIQQDEPDQELAFQKAFTLELIASLGFFVLVAAVVPFYAAAYGHPEIILGAIVCARLGAADGVRDGRLDPVPPPAVRPPPRAGGGQPAGEPRGDGGARHRRRGLLVVRARHRRGRGRRRARLRGHGAVPVPPARGPRDRRGRTSASRGRCSAPGSAA